MQKYKVFLPTGTVQTILAQFWEIDRTSDNPGTLRFFVSPNPNENRLIAIFPPGGWHGMQDVSVYEDTRKAVV